MKDYKRAERRWKSTCKFEKRINIWVHQGMYLKTDNNDYCGLGGHQLEDVKNEIRDGKFWTFLKETSTPCSCSMCSYPKYDREPKGKVNKKIWDDIQGGF